MSGRSDTARRDAAGINGTGEPSVADGTAQPVRSGQPAQPGQLRGVVGDGEAVDPRTARTDRKIVAGALKLLREAGPQKVTIEAVSALTGVAKTSIYRRYANSADMLEAALEHLGRPGVAADPRIGWAEALGTTVAELLQDMGVGVALTLLEDPHSATSRVLRRQVIRPRMEALRDLLDRDVQRGLIRPGVDLDIVIDFVLGAAYAHTARYGQLGADWTQRVHHTLTALVHDPRAASPEASPHAVPGPDTPTHVTDARGSSTETAGAH